MGDSRAASVNGIVSTINTNDRGGSSGTVRCSFSVCTTFFEKSRTVPRKYIRCFVVAGETSSTAKINPNRRSTTSLPDNHTCGSAKLTILESLQPASMKANIMSSTPAAGGVRTFSQNILPRREAVILPVPLAQQYLVAPSAEHTCLSRLHREHQPATFTLYDFLQEKPPLLFSTSSTMMYDCSNVCRATGAPTPRFH